MTAPRPYWLTGSPVTSDEKIAIHNPEDGGLVAHVSIPSPHHVECAVVGAMEAAKELAGAPAHVRASALSHVSQRLHDRRDEVAELIRLEVGKPIKWAQVEVSRAASTFRWAAEEARRWSGHMQRLDTDPTAEQRLAVVRRVPRGPVLAIVPFNFPLNLVAHKVAPALAVGCPILVKPAPATPLSALLLGEILSETSLPAGAVSVLPVPNDRMPTLVQDPRIPVISFTGSVPVGWAIRDAVPRKHVTLELGGNAAVIICQDWSSDEDLAYAAARVATFATYQAGQSCISVQRVAVAASRRQRFEALLVEAMKALVTGCTADPSTDVGPLINLDAARRVETWVEEAVAAGATTVMGGVRRDTFFDPTLLTHVPRTAKVWADEVFGPVLVLETFETLEEAFDLVNASRFGLQAGVFTHDIEVAFQAHRNLDVGGVIIGDVPSFRADQMPYGGTKDSGIGREGVRAAMEDMSVERVLVLTGVSL